MVEVFRTNVEEKSLADQLTQHLQRFFPHYKINFDLEDCDRILRVEGNRVTPELIIKVMNTTGHQCHALE